MPFKYEDRREKDPLYYGLGGFECKSAKTLKDCISELRWTLPMFLGTCNAYAIPPIDLLRLRADPTTPTR